MSNLFEDISGSAASALLGVHGEPAPYTPAGGRTRTVTAILPGPSVLFMEEEDGEVVHRRMTVRFAAADVPNLGPGDTLGAYGLLWGLETDLGAEMNLRAAAFVNTQPMDKSRSQRRTRGAP